MQILSDVTNDLKTMSKHADAAVETLNTYETQRKALGDWLDRFYLTQCWIATILIDSEGKDNLTRETMQRYADALHVKYVYLFDKNGRVRVTNGPYDHLTLSTNPEDFTYAFLPLLEGVEYVLTAPMNDKWLREYIQYMGMSLRDKNDLSDGFVLIGVDPTLRDSLLSPLSVDTVLNNMIIGLPEYAIAIDKNTLKVAATTGIGYVGSSIEDLGLTMDNLRADFSGFLKINGVQYYAGVSESSEYFLVPIVRRTNSVDSLVIALKLTLYALCTSLVIVLLTLFRYQRVVIDGAPASEPEAAIPDMSAMPDADARSRRRLSNIPNLLRLQKKQGFEERWRMSGEPKVQQTPEKRISTYIYRLLLLFCLLILLPTLYLTLNGKADSSDLNNLAYVISGHWQRGLNIFAFTSCVFLLCAMYVAVVLLNRILYLVAKVSDMRVETVCLLLRNAIKYICVIVFVYYGLAQFGVDTQTLLTSAGIMSLMVSFGAKDMVSDIIAGFFTIIEGTYKVGDFVTVGDWYGTVTEIGPRTTKVRFVSHTKIFNNSSMRDIISADEVVRVVLNAPTSYDANLTEIEAVLQEELPKLKDVIPGLVKAPQYEGVSDLADSSVNLVIAIYVDCAVKDPALRRLNREIKLIFDRRGIEIPFNQLVIHNAGEAGK